MLYTDMVKVYVSRVTRHALRVTIQRKEYLLWIKI